MFYNKYRNSDPKNSRRERNIKNSDKDEYNCAGYALNCFSWYCPLNHHEYDVDIYAKQILIDFPNVRIISSEKELKNNEYIIAFRISSCDFHFMKRSKNGNWFEKRGWVPVIYRIKKEKVFNEIWSSHRYDGGYNSKIILFAVKE